MNAAERIRVVLAGGSSSQNNGMIGSNPAGGFAGVRVSPAEVDPSLGASDEEGAATVEHVETLELHVGAIPHVERSGLGYDGVEDVDVVQFSVGNLNIGNLNQCRDRATQIEQSVHLDGGLVGSKPGSGEQRQAEVDGGGVQGIDGVVEIETERLAGIQGAGDADQHWSEVGEDAPVVRLVGAGPGGA